MPSSVWAWKPRLVPLACVPGSENGGGGVDADTVARGDLVVGTPGAAGSTAAEVVGPVAEHSSTALVNFRRKEGFPRLLRKGDLEIEEPEDRSASACWRCGTSVIFMVQSAMAN